MKTIWIGKSIRVFLVLFLTACSTLSAAGPVTHGYLAERYLNATGFFTAAQDRASFFQGVFFPDSRYITGVERVSTHFDVNSINEVYSENEPFIAGMKHHAFVDKERGVLLREYGVTACFDYTEDEEVHSYCKFLEDHILFDRVDRTSILNAFLIICRHDLLDKIPKSQWIRWQQLLQLSFSYSPGHLISMLALTYKGVFKFSPELIQRWNHSFEADCSKEEFCAYVEILVIHFDLLNSDL